MRLDPNPLFRKIIAPWYDSAAACWIFLVAVFGIAVFSITGWVVARETDEYHGHTWVPVTLLFLCLFVLFSLIRRLIHRHYDRYTVDKEP
jgi:hypothetical protein